MKQRKELFDFMMARIKEESDSSGLSMPQAFGQWFAKLYFQNVQKVYSIDGSGDGKVDAIVNSQKGKSICYYLLNTKFTNEYDKSSPVSFYDEITRYWQAFENKQNRVGYLKVVRPNLQGKYRELFKNYDEGRAHLFFLTNHEINERQYESVRKYGVTIYHLDDILEYVAEYIEGAMPETDSLTLTSISNVLTPATHESEVPTSIVFAKLADFMEYMENDPFGLLFARNVRLWLGNTETNKSIRQTYINNPREFAYSNNGITVLCKKHTYLMGKQELIIENPRVVNGSQTLHSITDVDEKANNARVMVRIIEVPGAAKNISEQIARRKDIIHKISIRSNLQNPIKKWNLVSNDDFQNEISRYFWNKGFYYERRQNEWKVRKVELQGLGLRPGPDIKWMTQLIAAYYYETKMLGPAIAYGQLHTLFEEEPYDVIHDTKVDLIYQLYLMGVNIERSMRYLRARKKYISNIYGYIDFAVVSIMCKALRKLSIRIGTDTFETFLGKRDEYDKKWNDLVKEVIDHILMDYKKQYTTVKRKEGKELNWSNYFKNKKYVGALIEKDLPKAVVIKAKRLFLS